MLVFDRSLNLNDERRSPDHFNLDDIVFVGGSGSGVGTKVGGQAESHSFPERLNRSYDCFDDYMSETRDNSTDGIDTPPPNITQFGSCQQLNKFENCLVHLLI